MAKVRRMRRLVLILALLCLGGLACLVMVLNAGLMGRVEALREGEAEKEVPLEVVVVRNETVVPAPLDGVLSRQAEEGERVGKGFLFASIEAMNGRHALRAPQAGIVSYRLDGLEEALDQDDPWTPRTLPDTTTVSMGDGQEVSSGQPLARIVDNLSAVVLRTSIKAKELPAEMLKAGATWSLRAKEDERFSGQVIGLFPQGEETGVCLRVDSYPERFLNTRQVLCHVITDRMSGLVVPEKAIVSRNGRPGLYLVRRGLVYWAPIKEEGRLDGRVFISGQGLESGTRFVVDPRWVREGVLLEQ